MFERGGPEGVGVWGSSHRKFCCLKWPILTEMTVKYGIYFYFFCQQGGYPPCGAEWGGSGPPPPRTPPLAETLPFIIMIYQIMPNSKVRAS